MSREWGCALMQGLFPREMLVLARRTAQRVQKDASTPAKRFGFCKLLVQSDRPDTRLEALRQQLSRLPKDERHYWIGTFYALLLPATERRSKATYFTPPHLARSIIALACKNGFDIKKHTAIDPAAGGAAFLSTLALQMRESGLAASSITNRLSGVELDSGLASLSEALIGDQLGIKIAKRAIVTVGKPPLAVQRACRIEIALRDVLCPRIGGGAACH